jgi:uncharacterized membrane protein HdeD (DUF308 family)
MNIVASDRRSLALRGAAGVLFGLTALVWPEITLLALVLLWGAYVLVNGFSSIWAVVRGAPEAREQRGLLLLSGIVSVVAGIVTFLWPGITALVLLYIIAGWALVTGVLDIVAAIRLRKELTDEWRWVLSGILSIVFAAILAITPGAGALAITWVIGWFAILDGVIMLSLAWKARSIEPGGERRARHLRPQSA